MLVIIREILWIIILLLAFPQSIYAFRSRLRNNLGRSFQRKLILKTNSNFFQTERMKIVILDHNTPSFPRDNIEQNVFYIYLWYNNMLETELSQSIRSRANFTIFAHNDEVNQSDNTDRLHSLIQKLETSSVPFLKRPSVELEAGRFSHFLSLTYPDLQEAIPDLPELRKGIDAFELRVDLLADQSPRNIHKQIAILRSFSSQLPIIYTVRTKNQIGNFPDEDYERIEGLLLEGIKAGVEWLDIEANLPKAVIQRVSHAAKTSPLTRIIGSYHTREVCFDQTIQEMFTCCDLDNAADLLKVVTGAETLEDSLRIHAIGKQQSKPYIGLCLGEVGAYSRVLNERYTPVTHERMRSKAAPGQLTVSQLQSQRLHQGLLLPRQYYLFGFPIQQSLSPALHNTAYKTLAIPSCRYELQESSQVEDYSPVLQKEEFSGASVTIPHKETIIPYLSYISEEARCIGAVNTIINCIEERESVKPERRGRSLHGLNTDWLGMYKPIAQLLIKKGDIPNRAGVGLVIGAGGTARAACYALQRLGLTVVIANRQIEKAQALANRFSGIALSLDELANLSHSSTIFHKEDIQVIISTLPVSANYTLPLNLLLHHPSPPIVLDVVYKPALTPLLAQAKGRGCAIIQGATMLLEQAIEQFQIWNERLAPREAMRQILFENIEKIDSVSDWTK